jgi:hypothetical protein
MLHPMRALLDVVDPWLPPSLLADPWRLRIQRLAERLPPAFGWGLFECRLGRGEPRVDFLVCASSRDGGREALRAAFKRKDKTANAAIEPALDFVKAWSREGSELYRGVPLIWLEYDLPPDQDPRPIVFPCIDPTYQSSRPVAALTPAELRIVAARALRLVLGREVSAAVLDTLVRCAELLPAGKKILALAALPRRGPEDVRIYVSLRPAEVWPWLQAIGWPGPARLIDRGLKVVGSDTQLLGIHVDIAEGVGPYFAAELYAGPSPAATAAGNRLLERLIRNGACDPDKGEAVARWTGDTKVDLPGAEWRISVNRQFYLKVVPRLKGPHEAKAYLGFHPRFTLL